MLWFAAEAGPKIMLRWALERTAGSTILSIFPISWNIYVLDSTDGMTRGKGHSWESEYDVPVSQCESIADVYSEILREESLGNLVIHRYSEVDPAKQKNYANYIRDHLTDEGEEMAKFYSLHFSPLWD